jgi:hypothetical protein
MPIEKKNQDCNNEVVETEKGDIKSLQRKGPSNRPPWKEDDTKQHGGEEGNLHSEGGLRGV